MRVYISIRVYIGICYIDSDMLNYLMEVRKEEKRNKKLKRWYRIRKI